MQRRSLRKGEGNKTILLFAAVAAEGENVPSDLVRALEMILQGVQLLGNGLTLLITYALAAIGIHVPQIAIQLGAITLVILFLWKLGNAVSKIVLYAMIFLLISLFAGLIPAIGEYLTSAA
jgi:hypothetical protein